MFASWDLPAGNIYIPAGSPSSELPHRDASVASAQVGRTLWFAFFLETFFENGEQVSVTFSFAGTCFKKDFGLSTTNTVGTDDV
jgi:hypothetical protein